MTGSNVDATATAGPLSGIKVLELAGQGPGPYGAMLLADLGADVVRIDRPPTGKAGPAPDGRDIVGRGRRSVALDLKSADGIDLALRLTAAADVLIDPFRPGVAERLGIGPQVCLERNPRLVYARVTGFGQDGPLAPNAGHDINYVALGGALAHIGRAGGPPAPPLNLVADMGGGMLLAFGVASALVERSGSGRGQIVDAAMIDGVASLMSMTRGFLEQGIVDERRGHNVIDGGAPFYDVYECADGRYVSVGAIEPEFYLNLVTAVGLDPDELPRRRDRSRWKDIRSQLAQVFRTRTRDEWCELLEHRSELCFAPVLTMTEAPAHPHHVARQTFVEVDGTVQPAPAPRFSRTPGSIGAAAAAPGEHTQEVVHEWLGGG